MAKAGTRSWGFKASQAPYEEVLLLRPRFGSVSPTPSSTAQVRLRKVVGRQGHERLGKGDDVDGGRMLVVKRPRSIGDEVLPPAISASSMRGVGIDV